MITVAALKAALADVPDEYTCYAYESESEGVVGIACHDPQVTHEIFIETGSSVQLEEPEVTERHLSPRPRRW